MLKVAKFGGSSLADEKQFAKVRSIVEADPGRKVIVVSAPGKRFSKDNKITDILFANNIMRAVLSTTNKSYARFLTQ